MAEPAHDPIREHFQPDQPSAFEKPQIPAEEGTLRNYFQNLDKTGGDPFDIGLPAPVQVQSQVLNEAFSPFSAQTDPVPTIQQPPVIAAEQQTFDEINLSSQNETITESFNQVESLNYPNQVEENEIAPVTFVVGQPSEIIPTTETVQQSDNQESENSLSKLKNEINGVLATSDLDLEDPAYLEKKHSAQLEKKNQDLTAQLQQQSIILAQYEQQMAKMVSLGSN